MYKAGYDRPENAICKIDVRHLTWKLRFGTLDGFFLEMTVAVLEIFIIPILKVWQVAKIRDPLYMSL